MGIILRALGVAYLFGFFYIGSVVLMVAAREPWNQSRQPTNQLKEHRKCSNHGLVQMRRVGVENAPVYSGPRSSSRIIGHAKYFSEAEMLDYHIPERDGPYWKGYSISIDSVEIKFKQSADFYPYWERVSIGEQDGWILAEHTISYHGGPDRHLEWDIREPDKILAYLAANRHLRLESRYRTSRYETAKPLSGPINEIGKYRDGRAINYIGPIIRSNMKQADGTNNDVIFEAIHALGKIGDKSSVPLLYTALTSYYGVFEDRIREEAANIILSIVKDGLDYHGYAKHAATEILANEKYTKECKEAASGILSKLRNKKAD